MDLRNGSFPGTRNHAVWYFNLLLELVVSVAMGRNLVHPADILLYYSILLYTRLSIVCKIVKIKFYLWKKTSDAEIIKNVRPFQGESREIFDGCK